MIESKDKAEGSEKILAAAFQLFAKTGYKGTTLERVATLAGLTKGAVYYYFKSKEQLFLRVLQEIEKRSIDQTIAAIAAKKRSPTEQLRSFVRLQASWATHYPNDLVIVMLASIESVNQKSMARTQMSRFYKKISVLLERIIVAGKRSGEFKTNQETADIVMYLMAIHDGNMLLWYRSGTKLDVGRMLTLASLAGVEHAVGAVASEPVAVS